MHIEDNDSIHPYKLNVSIVENRSIAPFMIDYDCIPEIRYKIKEFMHRSVNAALHTEFILLEKYARSRGFIIIKHSTPWGRDSYLDRVEIENMEYIIGENYTLKITFNISYLTLLANTSDEIIGQMKKLIYEFLVKNYEMEHKVAIATVMDYDNWRELPKDCRGSYILYPVTLQL